MHIVNKYAMTFGNLKTQMISQKNNAHVKVNENKTGFAFLFK